MTWLNSAPYVKNKWDSVIKSVVKFRVSSVEEGKIVEFFKAIEKSDQKSDFLINIVMEQTSKVLNDLFDRNPVNCFCSISFSNYVPFCLLKSHAVFIMGLYFI